MFRGTVPNIRTISDYPSQMFERESLLLKQPFSLGLEKPPGVCVVVRSTYYYLFQELFMCCNVVGLVF